MRSILRWLPWTLLLALGCVEGSDEPPPDAAPRDPPTPAAPLDATPDAAPPVAAPPDAWFACERPTDCVVFEAECCDHCNGGRVVSVNATYEDEARAALGPTGCEGVPCTARDCAPEVPTCEAGRCGSVPDPAWGGEPCAGLVEAACEVNVVCTPIRGADAAPLCIDDFDGWMSEYGGCMTAGQGCGDAETCAHEPHSGRRVVFPSTCVPSGWPICNTQPCEPAAACEDSEAAPPGVLCAEGGADGRVAVQVMPQGCFSSSCTRRVDVFCRVTPAGADLDVDATFCLAPIEDAPGCTPDCSGGGFARCLADLEPGTYTARLGDLEVTFDHPGPRVCVGEMF